MSTGLSGTYAINTVDICPESAQWLDRDVIGIDGDGHPIYPAFRQFQFTWGLMPMSDYFVLFSAQQITENTGTVTVDLPNLEASDYRFTRYSGCILHEPTVGAYFTDHVTDVRLLVTRIRT